MSHYKIPIFVPVIDDALCGQHNEEMKTCHQFHLSYGKLVNSYLYIIFNVPEGHSVISLIIRSFLTHFKVILNIIPLRNALLITKKKYKI